MTEEKTEAVEMTINDVILSVAHSTMCGAMELCSHLGVLTTIQMLDDEDFADNGVAALEVIKAVMDEMIANLVKAADIIEVALGEDENDGSDSESQ